jgi:glutaryl-CoA dehydrogenase
VKPIPALDLIDGDALLNEEELLVRETVSKFCDKELRPNIARWYDEGAIPARDLAKTLGSMGLLGMHLKGYGCPGMSATAYGLACLELESVDSGIRSFASVQGSLSMTAIHRYGSSDQKESLLSRMATGEIVGCFGLTEPDFGSNPGGMRTVATRDGTDWIINGSKLWITNGAVADIAIVWAQTPDGIRGFVIPTNSPGFSAPPVPHKLSLRASVTSQLVLEYVRLPDAAVLPGARGLSGPLGCLNEARFGIIFGTVGAARDCLAVATDYALSRVQFGRPIAAYQLTQEKLADSALELQKAYLLALHVARLKDQGRATPEQVSIAKLNNCREAIRIARTARTILGANGITLDYSPMRHANNLESVLTYEGTSEVHLLSLGRALTGLNALSQPAAP